MDGWGGWGVRCNCTHAVQVVKCLVVDEAEVSVSVFMQRGRRFRSAVVEKQWILV